MRNLPLNLPKLPLSGEPDGSYIKLKRDGMDRWYIIIYDEEGNHIDEMHGYYDANEALAGVAIEYPGASFDPER